MKFLIQFGIITGLTLIGQVLNFILPFPVPASVWGMVLLFILLCLHIIRLEQIEQAADFLLSIMTVMFVPVGAGLIQSYSGIKNELFSIFAVIILSTLVCFFITGKVSQWIIAKQAKRREN